MPLPVAERREVGGRRGLAGQRPGRVDARLERVERAAQRVHRHRRGDVGGARQPRGGEHGERQHRRARLCAVDQREALLGRERDRRQTGARERVGAGQVRPQVLGLALADQHQREVRERRQVAARADRAARRHARVHPRVEQGDQRVERPRPDAGKALGEHVRAKRHQRAHDRRRQRIAHARGMAPQQIQLQRGELVRRNGHVGERAEPGVDAVHGACRAPRVRPRRRARRSRARARRPTRRRARRRRRCATARRV